MKLKVHHQLLAMGLSPNELKVYCYLMSCATDGIAIVRAGRIAERCQISRATVQTACTSMAAKGVLSKVNRYADGHLVANAYHLSTFTGRFFMLDADAAVFGLSGSVFTTYLAFSPWPQRQSVPLPTQTSCGSAPVPQYDHPRDSSIGIAQAGSKSCLALWQAQSLHGFFVEGKGKRKGASVCTRKLQQ